MPISNVNSTRSASSVSVDADGVYTLFVGSAEFGNGTTTVHAQLAAYELNTVTDRIVIHQSNTATTDYDPGAFGSAGTVLPRTLRNYHIPQLADVPVTEVYFADTYDELGPLGANMACGQQISSGCAILIRPRRGCAGCGSSAHSAPVAANSLPISSMCMSTRSHTSGTSSRSTTKPRSRRSR